MFKVIEQYTILTSTYGVEKIDNRTYAAWVDGCLLDKAASIHAVRQFLLNHAKNKLADLASELVQKARHVDEALASLDREEHALARSVAQATARPETEAARIVYDALLDSGVAFTVNGASSGLHIFHMWNPDVYIRCLEDDNMPGVPRPEAWDGIFICGTSAARQFYLMLTLD
jgi:hypothetical protein